MKPLPVEIPRFRTKWFCRQGVLEYPINGPIYLMDDKLYETQSVSKDQRSLTSVQSKTAQQPWYFGPGSNELNTSGYPLGISMWLIGTETYDSDRDLHWISPKFNLQVSGRSMSALNYVLLPPHSLSGDDVEVVYAQCADYNTENFPHWRDRGVSIHNPGIITRHASNTPYTFWVRGTQWQRSLPSQGSQFLSIIDTKWLRIDILGLESALMAQTTLGHIFGFELLTSPVGHFVPRFGTSVFCDYFSQLEQFRARAMDKASRGAMDVMVTLIELPKTIKLVKGLCTSLRKLKTAIRVAKSDVFYHDPVRARLLAQKWLEARYGWRQIVFDAQGLSRLFLGALKRLRRSYTSGTSLGSGMWIESDETDPIYVGTTAITVQHIGTNCQLRSGVALVANIADTWYKKLYQLMGGFNITGIIYELTKLSWVLDWIYDVGSLINVWLRDPARYDRAWHTLSMPYESSGFIVRGEISAASLYFDDAFTGVSNYILGALQQFLGDDEDVYELLGRTGRAAVYIRVTLDASRYPLVIPKGILIRSGSQIADLLSLMVVHKR